MNTVSISQLKINPSQAIRDAADFPIAVENRSKVKAYLIGKDLFEMITASLEDIIDRKAVEKTDFKKGRPLEEVVSELGI